MACELFSTAASLLSASVVENGCERPLQAATGQLAFGHGRGREHTRTPVVHRGVVVASLAFRNSRNALTARRCALPRRKRASCGHTSGDEERAPDHRREAAYDHRGTRCQRVAAAVVGGSAPRRVAHHSMDSFGFSKPHCRSIPNRQSFAERSPAPAILRRSSGFRIIGLP